MSTKFRMRSSRSRLAFHGAAALLVFGATALGIGCSSIGPGEESTSSTSQALTASISGTVFGSNGQPLQGATVTLQGNATGTTTTNAAGQYSFNVNTGSNPSGSFDLHVTDPNCTSFNPSGGFIALNNIRGSSANNNFFGVGASCVSAQVDAGGSSAVDPGPRQGAAAAGCAAVTGGNDSPFTSAADNHSAAQIIQSAACCIPTLSNAATPAEPGTDPNNPGTLLQDANGKAIAGTLEFCAQAVVRFQELDSVSGPHLPGVLASDTGSGLGPTFNSFGCSTCHAQPGVMGSSPHPNSPQVAIQNPQILAATRQGATNVVPPFITANGPVREERFPIAAGGGVVGLFNISGRTDAQGCTGQQPNFAAQIAANDIIFRIPTPTFGLGLVENVQEQTLEVNLNVPPAGAPSNASLGINGVLNRSGNDGTITRFGWKAQNKSLLIFVGEAYNVEQGVSNENFPEERHGGEVAQAAACFNINPTPEDATNIGGNGATPTDEGTASDILSDTANFAAAERLAAPPTPATGGYTAGFTNAPPVVVAAASIANGQTQFISVGCANCHTPSLTTGPKSSFDPALAGVTFNPFSDFALHHMGTGLADGVNQGGATGDQFRSAPLWGVGQRIFFLHDGRTTDIVTAIEGHASSGSEATTVVSRFNALSPTNQQDLVNFLRSL
jgi:CxxC motif-containing protein (DUF1111 family)